MRKQIYLLLISLALGSFLSAQTHDVSSLQKLPEGTSVGNLIKSYAALAYYGTPTYIFACPDTYGDDEFGVRFTATFDNGTLDSTYLYFYQETGTPDVNVNVYDVATGLPGTLLGTLVVPNASITINGWTSVDLSSLGLTFNTGDEFFITYSVVGGANGSVQMDILSDDGGTTEDRSVENYAGTWGTMTNDWGDNYEFLIVAFLSSPNTTCAAANAVGPGTHSDPGPSTGGGAANICFTGATNASWYSFTPDQDGTVTIESITSGEDTRLSFYDGTCGALNCVDSDDDGGSGYLSLISDVPVTGGTTYYIEWDDRWSSNPFDWTLTYASCVAPTAQTTTSITTTGADLGWTSVDSFFDVFIDVTGVTPPDASTTPTADDVSNPYTWAGGTAATTYDWWVRTDCGQDNTDVSDWVGPMTFTTACNAVATFPFSESFETAVPPACWSITNVNGTSGNWLQNSGTHHPTGNPAQDGTYVAYLNSWSAGSGNDTRLETPDLDLSALSACTLDFWMFHDNGYNTSLDSLYIQVYDGSSWATLSPGYGRYAASNGWENITVDLSSYAGSTIKVGFLGVSHYGNDVHIDNVSIYEPSADAMDWNNLQWPDVATIDASQNETIYTQGWEPGVTDSPGQGPGIMVWIGYSTTDTDPATWTDWVSATYNTDAGNNDEYMADLGAAQGLAAGTYYYASRWQLNSGPYTYGGYNSGGGGFWDGINNVSGVLTVNPIDGDDCTNPIAISEVIDEPFDNTYATQSGYNPGCGSTYTDPYDLWYEYTASYTGDVTVDLCGSGFDTRIALWDACGGTALDCNDDFCGLQSAISFSVTAGNTYLIQVGGYGSAQGTGDLTIAYSSTEWTGAAKSYDWNDASNWTYGIPGLYTDVTIPAGLSNYPTLSSTGYCHDLNIASTSSGDASLMDNGNLTVNGTVNVERYLSADQYHSFSPSVDGETIGLFHLSGGEPDVYLYENNEATYDYTELSTPLTIPLNKYEGYMVWVDGANVTPPVSGWKFTETGTLNTGAFGANDNVTMSDPGGTQRGWNFFGNPYTSAIDWDATTGWTRTDVDGTVYIYNGIQWATYSNGSGGVNGGSQYIAMGQGFFVHKTDLGGPYPETGTLTMDNNVRVHNGVSYLKKTIANRVSLQVEGNGYSDETAILFREDATVGFDSEYDAYKIRTEQPGAPTLYSVGTTDLAVNVLPEADWVQLGFEAQVNGQYTISATEINDIGDVVLEDTFTGIMTDLQKDSYTFDYTVGDDVNRFIVHFAPLGVNEYESLFNIYSFGKDAYVAVPENTTGNIAVYNMMGQNVATSTINSTVNKIHLEDGGYYVVKVMSDNTVVTKKVFIK